jgi:hypothetical protein
MTSSTLQEKSVAAPPGPWTINRRPEHSTALARTGQGSTIAQLAEVIGLSSKPAEWRGWLRPHRARQPLVTRANGSVVRLQNLHATDPLAAGQNFRIPNTVVMVWTGDVGALGRWAVGWKRDRKTLWKMGFYCREEIFWGKITVERQAEFLGLFRAGTAEGRLHGLFITGHGHQCSFGKKRQDLAHYGEVEMALAYHLGLVIINCCNGNWSKHETYANGESIGIGGGGRDLIADSPGARFYGIKGILIPQLVVYRFHHRHFRDILKPGDQGTVI